MAENTNYIGVAMGLDVSDLKSGLAEASKSIGKANADFRAATGGMDDWTKSVEGISAKVTQLDTVLTAQRRKLAGLTAEYEKVAKEQGENSVAAQNLYIKMKNQEAVVKTTEREFNNFSETLKKAKDGTVDLEKVSLKAGKAVEKTGEAAEKAGDGFTIAKGAIAGFIANGLTALVGAAKNAMSSILGLSDATREYRRTMATLETAADDVGVSTDYIRDKFVELSGVFDDQDSLTEGLNNLLTAGFDESSLDSITQALEGAALKWKDTLKFEGLADSLQEWIGSGGESLTGNFAELLERMGYNLDDVKEKTAGMTAEQRRNYATNLLASEGLDEVSASYRAQNKDMVAAQQANARYEETVAKLGERIEPITTKIREGFTRILEKILELLEDVDYEAIAASIDKAFDKFINEIMPEIVSGLQWMIDNFDEIMAGIVAVGTAFLAWKVAGIIKAVTSAIKGMTAAQWALNVALNANPIGVIIMLIAGLVAGIMYLWKNSDKFKNFWINAWENIKSAASNAWSSIKSTFSNIGSWFSKKFKEARDGIERAFDGIKEFFAGVLDKIVGVFTGIKDKFITVGKNIVQGIWQGIKNGATWLKNKITGFAGDVADWFKSTFKINSPSKLMADEVGQYIGQGVGVGVLDSIPSVKKQLGKFSNFITDNLGGIKAGLDIGANGGGATERGRAGGGNTVVNAGMTVHYNGNLSRRELKRIENENYAAIKLKLLKEGAL